MPAKVQYDQRIAKAFDAVEKQGVVVLLDVPNFPIYREDFILPYTTVCLNKSGVAHVRFDQHEATLHANEIAVVGGHHILHALDHNDDYAATLIFISNELLQEIRLTSFDSNYQKFHFRPSFVVTPEEMQKLQDIVKVLDMVSSPNMNLPHRREALIRMIQVFMEVLTSFNKELPENDLKLSREVLVFNKFIDLLAENYRKEHEVQFYAEQLNLTPKYFSKIVNSVTGRGANAWINEYLVTKIKNLLITRPDLSLQRIGVIVGYTEQASFTRFFHKQTGMSPRIFREQHYK